MSNNIDKLLSLATQYESKSLELSKVAKTDSKAEVRNRGKVVFPAESSNVKDKKDHFPINSAAQARNALARVHQYSSVPSWYKGSLKGLQEAVARAVKKHYKDIDVGGKSKKSSAEFSLIKSASADAFYQVVQLYDNGTDCLKDFIEAMLKSAEVFAKESGGLDNMDDDMKNTYEVIVKEAKLLEKILPEMAALDQELYSSM